MADALDLVKTLLSDNWNSSSFPNVRIDYSFNSKRITTKQFHNVMLYREEFTHPGPTGVGFNYRNLVDTIKVEIRTKRSWNYLKDLFGEAKRIIATNRNNPSSNFHKIKILGFRDFPDFGFWRRVINLEVITRSEKIS